MGVRLRDHVWFQRGALALALVGGSVGFGAAVLGRGIGREAFAAVVGAAAAAIVVRAVAAAARGSGRVFGPALLGLGGAAAGVALAWLAFPALTLGLVSDATGTLDLAGQGGGGLLFGLVASLGLLPAGLERVRPDVLAAAFAAAGPVLVARAEERALAERARAAHARLAEGLGGDDSLEAARLELTARTMTLEVLRLATRAAKLRAELDAVDRAVITARAAELRQAAAATTDATARADFARAAEDAGAIIQHLDELAGAGDRVRARLALQVVALETTAIAVFTRRASSVAETAHALTPLYERLRDAGQELRAEAAALGEVGAAFVSPRGA